MISWRLVGQSSSENCLTQSLQNPLGLLAACLPAQQPAQLWWLLQSLSCLGFLLFSNPSATWWEPQDLDFLLAVNSLCPELCCRPKTFWLQPQASLRTLVPKLHHFLSSCYLKPREMHYFKPKWFQSAQFSFQSRRKSVSVTLKFSMKWN